MKKNLLAAALTAALIAPCLLNQEPKEKAERYTVGDIFTYTAWIEASDTSGTYTAKSVGLNKFPTDPYKGMRVLYFPESGRIDLEEFYSGDELEITGEYVEFE